MEELNIEEFRNQFAVHEQHHQLHQEIRLWGCNHMLDSLPRSLSHPCLELSVHHRYMSDYAPLRGWYILYPQACGEPSFHA